MLILNVILVLSVLLLLGTAFAVYRLVRKHLRTSREEHARPAEPLETGEQ